MSVLSILETLLIGPLKLAFEVIFSLANKLVGHPGGAIIFLSLIMNILVLPLYRRADAMQEEARDIDAKLDKGVSHIKKTFSGDERMMILQTYYRQNNYKPTDALNGSVSLLLEIPFFMAAYQFLSHLVILSGVSLGPIRDLGAPDGLLVLGGVTINVLPFLMTLVNLISSSLYLKGFPLKTKIQLYGMAVFFLIFLYNSPSCLVFYWTLNNLFSLVKTIFYKIKNPEQVLRVLMCLLGIALLGFGLFVYQTPSIKRRGLVVGVALALILPMVLPALKALLPARSGVVKQVQPNGKMLLLGGLFLTVLVGLMIPATFIAASPQEYIDPTYFHNPMWYLVSSGCLAAGTFLVWLGVFYWLANPVGKVIMERLVWVLCGVALLNYMCFGTNLGNMSFVLQYDEGMAFTLQEQLLNLAALAGLAVVMWLIAVKKPKLVTSVLLTAVIAVGSMSALHVHTINGSLEDVKTNEGVQAGEEGMDSLPHFSLSKEGQNVVVLMLDRAMNQYIPYLFHEKPELEQQFDGFTYYSNTISFGCYTNFGTPALLGGYEYTPVEMNRRDQELLVDKHNEALKVMPVLFMENGYDVTVCDPVYANYQWIPDLSIYDEYPEIDAYITKGAFSDIDQKQQIISNNRRNFFCFALMKSMPLCLQPTIYSGGSYNQTTSNTETLVYSTQTQESTTKANGLFKSFMDSYNVFLNLPEMTRIQEGEGKNFLLMTSDLTHEPMMLQEPEYVPAPQVDNTPYYTNREERFTLNGRTLRMDTVHQVIHYQTNMATMLQLGKWFDYLRENDVYDNTRIILVADHGRNLNQIEELSLENKGSLKDLELYYPLLMVKDFNSTGFTTSTEFMTNGDVPTMATDGVIEDPRNPFTGKPINNLEKTAHDQFVLMSWNYNTIHNNGYTYQASQWASVKEDLWNRDNWTFYPEVQVLKEHAAP